MSESAVKYFLFFEKKELFNKNLQERFLVSNIFLSLDSVVMILSGLLDINCLV